VRVTIFDVLGRTVASLVDGMMEPGVYSVQWSGKDVPSGMYFCRMEAGSFTQVVKMALQK
jgi:hypothetical protein